MSANTHDHGVINKPPPTAWASVIMMIVGLIICALAFILGMNIPLWIIGGVIGGSGIILAKLCNIMEHSH